MHVTKIKKTLGGKYQRFDFDSSHLCRNRNFDCMVEQKSSSLVTIGAVWFCMVDYKNCYFNFRISNSNSDNWLLLWNVFFFLGI